VFLTWFYCCNLLTHADAQECLLIMNLVVTGAEDDTPKVDPCTCFSQADPKGRDTNSMIESSALQQVRYLGFKLKGNRNGGIDTDGSN